LADVLITQLNADASRILRSIDASTDTTRPAGRARICM